MEAAIIIGLVVWFIASIPATTEKARNVRMREERERAEHAREDAYFAELKARADAGDKQAVGLLKSYGYDARAHGWEPPIAYTDEARIEQMIADAAARRAQLSN